jgi:hypothetical protein
LFGQHSGGVKIQSPFSTIAIANFLPLFRDADAGIDGVGGIAIKSPRVSNSGTSRSGFLTPACISLQQQDSQAIAVWLG